MFLQLQNTLPESDIKYVKYFPPTLLIFPSPKEIFSTSHYNILILLSCIVLYNRQKWDNNKYIFIKLYNNYKKLNCSLKTALKNIKNA